MAEGLTSMRAIIWKEWRQQRPIFFWGTLACLVLPVFEMFYRWQQGYGIQSETASAIVGFAGPVLAMILAAATAWQDTDRGLAVFWQSRPVRPGRLFASKLLVGAAVLCASFLIVISLEMVTSALPAENGISRTPFGFAWRVFANTLPVSVLLFSLTVFFVVLLRDMLKAVLLSVWAALLLYFAPLLIGPLRWLNIIERMSNDKVPSVMQYLYWKLTTPDPIPAGARIYRPVGIPEDMYKKTFTEGLGWIVSQPEYLSYLLFVLLCFAGAAGFGWLCVRTIRGGWRVKAGEKTLVWLLGGTAAAIFVFSMFHVGSNLEPVKTRDGKELINPVSLGWSYMPADVISENNSFNWSDRNQFVTCTDGDMMYRLTVGTKIKRDKKRDDNTPTKQHFILQIYRFPYAADNKADPNKLPNFVVGALSLYTTEPVKEYPHACLFGCFVRNNRLYAVYRPQIKEEKDNRIDIKNRPIMISTVDISNPARPKLLGTIETESTVNFCTAFAVSGDFCYISDGGQLLIVSVAEADTPKIIAKVRYRYGCTAGKCPSKTPAQKSDYFHPPSYRFAIVGDKLLCSDYNRAAILDISEPNEPILVFEQEIVPQNIDQAKLIQAAVYRDGYLYLANGEGILVYQMVEQPDGTLTASLAGQRLATPLERFADRYPKELMFYNGYLIECAGSFGLLVYDISDPARPKRTYHANEWVNKIGQWNGLLYAVEWNYKYSFYKIP